MKPIVRYFLAFLCLWFSSCHPSDNLFTNLPAYFIMENVYQAPVLYTSLQSPGEFCSIRSLVNSYEFASPTQNTPSYVNHTQMAQYSGFCLGLSGLIVGLPHTPEIGKEMSQVVCFELACPNCYHTGNITKPTRMQAGGYTQCMACQRLYDLNNQGMVVKGEAGKSLFRYKVSYSTPVLVVNNR